jgi:hypothetical protein
MRGRTRSIAKDGSTIEIVSEFLAGLASKTSFQRYLPFLSIDCGAMRLDDRIPPSQNKNMPNPNETEAFSWLQKNVGEALSSINNIREATDFGLLWMYFEGSRCEGKADEKRLMDFAKSVYSQDKRPTGLLTSELNYFRGVFGADGDEIKDETVIALLGKRTSKNMIALILRATTDNSINEVDVATALLFIVIRIRNNFFHGSKQQQSLSQQADVFQWASRILIKLLDASEPIYPKQRLNA